VNGYDLVALIFAREVSDPLISLIKTIDRQLGQSRVRNQGRKLGVFVVFCSDDPGLEKQLQYLIAREKLKNIVITLGTNKAQGPSRYRVAREAELTVVIYNGSRRVAANYVFDSEDLTSDRVNEIVTSLKKVLP
jgi:hypothetical protein